MSILLLLLITTTLHINSETINCGQKQSCSCSANNACTINCIGKTYCKDSTVQLSCKVGYKCTINCIGEGACSDADIIGTNATTLTVNCDGKDSCKGGSGNIICGIDDCELNCNDNNGGSACLDTTIQTNGAKSFQCYGTDCNGNNIPQEYSLSPTNAPTMSPTPAPTNPSKSPTENPTLKPTNNPTITPSKNPSISPTLNPTLNPSTYPTKNPSQSLGKRPSLSPTKNPTKSPSKRPSLSPTSAPTQLPAPTSRPTTSAPTRTSITANPSITPTKAPIKSSTNNPSILPTRNPSSITYTTQPTKSPAIAYPTISSSANPTINSVLRTNVPNESDTINPTKLSSVIPSVSSTKKSTLTTTVSDGITYTEKSVQESNENDISYLGLGMPLWMNAVIGFGIICCLLIVLMLCIRKRNKKSYVNFESADVNENDEQIVVRTDTHETHSNNSIKAEFSMGDLGASNSNLCEKNTFERGLMNNCVVSDILMEDIVDNMDTRGNIEMSNNNNNIVAVQGEAMDIQDSIEDINNNINDEQVMLQEIIKMANDTKVTAEGDNNI